MLNTLLLIGAVVIIIGLGIYAGKLLFLLQLQNKKQTQVRQQRIDNIQSSIQTIAFAMLQQQCELSEGAIRICNLLEALPIDPLPNYKDDYPSLFKLFESVKHFPTHQDRAKLSKKTRREQDKQREQLESEFESEVLKEAKLLKQFALN